MAKQAREEASAAMEKAEQMAQAHREAIASKKEAEEAAKKAQEDASIAIADAIKRTREVEQARMAENDAEKAYKQENKQQVITKNLKSMGRSHKVEKQVNDSSHVDAYPRTEVDDEIKEENFQAIEVVDTKNQKGANQEKAKIARISSTHD
ncbi:PREDICTED: uncharacterized protein LOC104596915 [Nelumbo nucifera]|uniref:Uncharacterized protein LOC104596915 n=1 Tax=Nelumbo nucifera TaxID=4432 RepID=A0A1U7ZSM9_NELNU|nr:PREDICTED: uncharacterized protein LOC104596915 [Nelumbo nucifera]